MTIFVTRQLRVTLDSIRNSCDVFFTKFDTESEIIKKMEKLRNREVSKPIRHTLACSKNAMWKYFRLNIIFFIVADNLSVLVGIDTCWQKYCLFCVERN